MKSAVVGIDIGGTNTPFGIINEQGEILLQGHVPTNKYEDVGDFVNDLSAQIKSGIITLDGKYEIVGIGLGAPNGNYYNGTIEHAPNLKWKGVVPLARLFKNHFDVPVVVTNDANAAAIGEMYFGVAQKMHDFIEVTLGTGLGSGFVTRGDIIYGHKSFGGELGHTIVEKNGRQCGCGRRGCLETYASVTGFMTTANEMLETTDHPSILRSIGTELTAQMISDAASDGDRLALEVFDKTAEKLALGLANAVAITNPEAVILFGGLANSGDLLLGPTETYFRKNLQDIFKDTKLMLSGVADNKAAILGAGALVWNELKHHEA